MNYELIKNEFIKLKREELDYIYNTAKISSNKTLSEFEKIEIYRKLKNYEAKLNEMLKSLWNEFPKDQQLTTKNWKDVIIEFDIDKKYLSSINFRYEDSKYDLLEDLGIDIETLKFKLTLYTLVRQEEYRGIDFNIIQHNQKLIENPIYIFCGYYDDSEDCYGPRFGEADDYLYGIYEDICDRYSNKKEISKKGMNEFEKNKIIIHSKRYVHSHEIRKIFEEELLNVKNKTINDCVKETKNRIQKLNYTRSSKYKEKMLLERINELYKTVKGELIKKEILYSDEFLDVLKQTYQLPNETTIQKETIIKNGGKNYVIIIGITHDKEYIVTFQNGIKDKISAEFISGYIESRENIIEASKRYLKEQTGYISDNLFIVDEVYDYQVTDNSVAYIIIADNCIKSSDKNAKDTKLINYGLFSKKELNYLINKNIMNEALNKLAYYNLINNVEMDQKICIKKKNSLNDLE